MCLYFIKENVSTISNRRRAVVAAVFEFLSSICLRPGRRRRRKFFVGNIFKAFVGVLMVVIFDMRVPIKAEKSTD